ncbi:hypothetical protein LEP1GSC188_3118 [Leptospira weilii serovar Topaz str. LT2116]|uniref:Uncharacterized protein n=1 Tax=Leptospira weilii serovar Topaz str. LT2116 TaxID=1088540 RepID=M3GVH1_9LEPT|nr:hypothetical protein LEP1GSC188_3118 [Leptospira weilii serovar Topaz str. LT2116]
MASGEFFFAFCATKNSILGTNGKLISKFRNFFLPYLSFLP